jgi:hypothetical protein
LAVVINVLVFSRTKLTDHGQLISVKIRFIYQINRMNNVLLSKYIIHRQ